MLGEVENYICNQKLSVGLFIVYTSQNTKICSFSYVLIIYKLNCFDTVIQLVDFEVW